MSKTYLNDQQEYLINKLGVSDALLRVGTRVQLKSTLDTNLYDHPGVDRGMLQYAGNIATVRSFRTDCRRFEIEEDNANFWWDPRWIEYILPDEDNFDYASDDAFIDFLLGV